MYSSIAPGPNQSVNTKPPFPAEQPAAASQAKPDWREQALAELARPIGHPKIREAANAAMTAATPGAGKHIVMVVGPTGVGKTRLAETMQDKLANAGLSTLGVELSQIGELDFSFKSLYMSIHEKLNEPPMPHRSPRTLPHDRFADPLRGSSCRFRFATVNALKRDRTDVILMDECAHILNAKSHDRLVRHAQTLRSFGRDSRTLLMMFCSYDGLPLLQIDRQLQRRITLIHFGRYNQAIPKDVKEYRTVVRTIGSRLQLNIRRLDKMVKPLMTRTLGCVGTTIDVFKAAVAGGLDDSGEFDYEAINRNLPSLECAEGLSREVLEAETLLPRLS